MSTTELDEQTEDPVEEADDPVEEADDPGPLYEDAATRVSNSARSPGREDNLSRFDEWYYGIEDKLGQGTIGMAVCLILFIVILLVAIVFKPI